MGEPPRFRDLLRELDETEGTEIVEELRRLKRTISIVNRNFEEVDEMDQWFMEQGVAIQLKKDRGDMDDFLLEYLRRYHNYIVSVYTLIKQTQRIKRADKYGTEEFDDVYDEGKERFDIEDHWEFLQQLRHFMQKSRLPSIDVTLIQEDEGVRFGLVVSRDELLAHGSFKSWGKEYLNSREDEIDIQAEMRAYHENVNEFYSWFFEALQDHRDDAINEREEIFHQMEEKRSELFDNLR